MLAWLEGDSQGLQAEQCNVLNASVGTDGCVPVEMKEVIPFYYTCLWVSVRIFLEDTGRVAGRLKVQDGFSACVETIQSTQGGNGTHGSWLRTEIPFFCAWTQQSQTLKTMHIRDDSISVRLTEPLALEEEHFIHLFMYGLLNELNQGNDFPGFFGKFSVTIMKPYLLLFYFLKFITCD